MIVFHGAPRRRLRADCLHVDVQEFAFVGVIRWGAAVVAAALAGIIGIYALLVLGSHRAVNFYYG